MLGSASRRFSFAKSLDHNVILENCVRAHMVSVKIYTQEKKAIDLEINLFTWSCLECIGNFNIIDKHCDLSNRMSLIAKNETFFSSICLTNKDRFNNTNSELLS